MEVVVENSVNSASVELGDIIHSIENGFYLVIKEGKNYIAKNLKTGTSGLTGYHATLEELSESLTRTASEITVYSASDYRLEIVKK